jgi:ribosomal protein S18 acetylase RimI-like enzyme
VPELPAGTRWWRPGDEVAMLDAAAACLERGEFEGVTRHDLEESFKRLPADPEMCAVAEEDGRVVGWTPADDRDHLVGFVRVQRYDDEGRALGDIGPVGLRRAWRGRGLGRQLLRWAVDDLRRRGAREVYLSVEGENDGALRLYESEGFGRDVEWPHWVHDLER